MQDGKISILVVDDHPIVRSAVKDFLTLQGCFDVIGESGSVAEALDEVRSCEPDVVLMDISLPDGNGIDATKVLTRDKCRRVLGFSAYDSADNTKAFFNAGGLGLVPKQSPLNELVDAINTVAKNKIWLSPSSDSTAHAKRAKSDKCSAILSPRETEIASWIAQGFSSTQIAKRLFLSPKTVQTHRYRIFKKLHIHSRAQLVKYALKHGLLMDAPPIN